MVQAERYMPILGTMGKRRSPNICFLINNLIHIFFQFQKETTPTVKPQITEAKPLLNKIERDIKPSMTKNVTKPAGHKLTETDVTHDNRINEARAVAIKPTTESVQTLCAELHRLNDTGKFNN